MAAPTGLLWAGTAAACQQFVRIGRQPGQVARRPAVSRGPRAEVGAKFDIADAERLVVEAMEESPDPSASGSWSTGRSWLKSKMLALDPSFDKPKDAIKA